MDFDCSHSHDFQIKRARIEQDMSQEEVNLISCFNASIVVYFIYCYVKVEETPGLQVWDLAWEDLVFPRILRLLRADDLFRLRATCTSAHQVTCCFNYE